MRLRQGACGQIIASVRWPEGSGTEGIWYKKSKNPIFIPYAVANEPSRQRSEGSGSEGIWYKKSIIPIFIPYAIAKGPSLQWSEGSGSEGIWYKKSKNPIFIPYSVVRGPFGSGPKVLGARIARGMASRLRVMRKES